MKELTAVVVDDPADYTVGYHRIAGEWFMWHRGLDGVYLLYHEHWPLQGRGLTLGIAEEEIRAHASFLQLAYKNMGHGSLSEQRFYAWLRFLDQSSP